MLLLLLLLLLLLYKLLWRAALAVLANDLPTMESRSRYRGPFRPLTVGLSPFSLVCDQSPHLGRFVDLKRTESLDQVLQSFGLYESELESQRREEVLGTSDDLCSPLCSRSLSPALFRQTQCYRQRLGQAAQHKEGSEWCSKAMISAVALTAVVCRGFPSNWPSRPVRRFSLLVCILPHCSSSSSTSSSTSGTGAGDIFPSRRQRDTSLIIIEGSYRLGVHGSGTDIDTLCVAPR